jgi:hypothetical protein
VQFVIKRLNLKPQLIRQLGKVIGRHIIA